ncbi:MAG: hypothetical protein E7597_06440 [Ruminococcaceae bacterium]|nr:hypothetical protein [Oscillospiraceae bacterium]
MKKLLITFLCLGLVLTACGGDDEKTESKDNAAESSTVSEESSEAVSAASNESSAISEEESSEAVSSESEESSMASEEESSEAAESAPDPMATSWDWYGEYTNSNNETFALLLRLDDDGGFTYSVGYVASDIISTVSGTWEKTDGVITFTGRNEASAEYTMVFEWRMEGDKLVLTHADGSSLLYGEDYASFVFTEFE